MSVECEIKKLERDIRDLEDRLLMSNNYRVIEELQSELFYLRKRLANKMFVR